MRRLHMIILPMRRTGHRNLYMGHRITTLDLLRILNIRLIGAGNEVCTKLRIEIVMSRSRRGIKASPASSSDAFTLRCSVEPNFIT
jgi:hypothetical protein